MRSLYEKRKEIIKVPVGTGLGDVATLPGFEAAQGEIPLPQFEERWTGAYIFENEWQSFRTRQDRELELKTVEHNYERPGRYSAYTFLFFLKNYGALPARAPG